MAEIAGDKYIKAQITRYESMPKPLKVIFVALTIMGIALFIYYILGWHWRGFVFPSGAYYYLLYMVFGSLIFVALPARKKDRGRVPWYDLVLSAFAFGIPLYLAFHAVTIVEASWSPPPDTFRFALGIIYCFLEFPHPSLDIRVEG